VSGLGLREQAAFVKAFPGMVKQTVQDLQEAVADPARLGPLVEALAATRMDAVFDDPGALRDAAAQVRSALDGPEA
jgi:hypothetical protein